MEQAMQSHNIHRLRVMLTYSVSIGYQNEIMNTHTDCPKYARKSSNDNNKS